MKLYAAVLLLAVAIAVLGVASELWVLVGVAVVAGFAGFLLLSATGQGTHPSGTKL
jgi:hypothetical protein